MKSTVPRKFIRTSFYPWKVSFWNLSRTLSGKHLEFCYENLGGVVKTGFSVSKETSLGKVFAKSTNYLQIVISFEYWAKRFRLTVEKKISGVFKLLSTCPWEIYQEKFFLKTFQHLWKFLGSFTVIEQKKFGGLVKTAFYVSIETFWRKIKF